MNESEGLNEKEREQIKEFLEKVKADQIEHQERGRRMIRATFGVLTTIGILLLISFTTEYNLRDTPWLNALYWPAIGYFLYKQWTA